MEPQEKMTTQEFIIDRLHDIQRKAEANNYSDALASIKEVKAADTKNIYLIAIEKQLAKLIDASLLPENRTEIIKSLPAMIERAISDAQRRASQVKPEDQHKEQKEAALEKLKSQYFQRADDYVSKQEYQRALEEIRRIYIIEPGSIVAKEYEQKIEQLAALHARAQKHEEPKSTAEVAVKPEPAAESKKEKYILEEEPKKSKLPIIAAAAVVVIAVGIWLVISQKPNDVTVEKQKIDHTTLAHENEPPKLPTTTTSTPQSDKAQAEVGETAKPTTKPTSKQQQETKTATDRKETTSPASAPVVTQQPIKQPTTQTQPTQTQSQITQKEATVSSSQPASQQVEQPKPTESSPAPVPFVAVESQPEIIKREPAKYPDIAVKMGIEGRVTVEVTVDPQGKPTQAKVVKTTSDIFNEAAIEAVMKYQFKPAMMSTGPVTAKVYVPISFTLRK